MPVLSAYGGEEMRQILSLHGAPILRGGGNSLLCQGVYWELK